VPHSPTKKYLSGKGAPCSRLSSRYPGPIILLPASSSSSLVRCDGCEGGKAVSALVDLAGRMMVMMMHVTTAHGGASQFRSASVGACVPMYATRQVLAVRPCGGWASWLWVR